MGARRTFVLMSNGGSLALDTRNIRPHLFRTHMGGRQQGMPQLGLGKEPKERLTQPPSTSVLQGGCGRSKRKLRREHRFLVDCFLPMCW